MADLIHVVQGDLESFASNAESLSETLSDQNVGACIAGISGTMAGAQSSAHALKAGEAVDHRISLRSQEYREFSENVSQTRNDYAHADDAAEQSMKAISARTDAPSPSATYAGTQKILERLGA